MWVPAVPGAFRRGGVSFAGMGVSDVRSPEAQSPKAGVSHSTLFLPSPRLGKEMRCRHARPSLRVQNLRWSRRGPRDPERTSASILAAAVTEFTEKGYAGARIDAIALRSGANKRMIYHASGDKEGLYLAVLESAYVGIRSAEPSCA